MPRKAVRREEVYDYIELHKTDNDGNSPTCQAIADHFGWKSVNTAWWHVQRLASEGRVTFGADGRIMLVPVGEYTPPSGRRRVKFSI